MYNTEPVSIRLPLTRLDSDKTYESFSRPLTEEESTTLRASIEAAGCILQPIIVEYAQARSKYVVIDGYNRWRNAINLGFDEVPCIQVFTEQQRLEALMANATRRQLSHEERKELLAKGRTAFAHAAQHLIPELRPLYESGDLAKIVGAANVLYLTNASAEKQRALYFKIQQAFRASVESKGDTHLSERVASLSAQIASMQRTTEQLEGDLLAAGEEKIGLQRKLETMESSIETLADKRAGQTKRLLEEQVRTLNERIATLSQQHKDAAHQAKVFEEQLKTAESEKKAAQIYARTAEGKAQTAQQRLASPQIMLSNFESIHKLIEAINAQIVAAKPLVPEDDKLINDHIDHTQTLLTDLANTMRATTGELIPFSRHVKPKGSHRSDSPSVQAQ